MPAVKPVDPACFSDGGIDANIDPSAGVAFHAGVITHLSEVATFSTPQRCTRT
jgi:hypothetical protein